MADSSGGFEQCLEIVLCILEGNGFKIILKSEQKKAIRKLYLKEVYFIHCYM